ncbi:MAG: LemA family protein [Candidatus Limnocylindrus sp.]
MELLLPLVIVGGLLLLVISSYNGLVNARNRVDEALGQIQVQLKRRYDLIPNLVEAVKGQMGFEKGVLESVTAARAAAVNAGATGNTAAQAKAENMLTSSLRTLFANVEAYPTLKSNENVIQLQEQLTSTENQIGFSRQHYNTSVLSYNNSVQSFPGLLFAGVFGFAKRDFFDAPDAEEAVPKVSLS